MEERRQHKRVAARMQVNVYDANGKKDISICRNISIGGMGIEADFLLARGTVVGLEFTMPYKEGFKLFKIKGKCLDSVYRGPEQVNAMSIQFVNLDGSMTDVIQDYVKDRVAI